MLKIILLLILSPGIPKVFALETDNYIVWDKDLKDSSASINRYMNELIEDSRSRSSSCEQMSKIVGSRLRSVLVHHNPIENWLMQNLSSAEVFPTSIHYVSQSIYRDPFLPHIPKFGLAANVQVNDYYFGTDKLSHFASTGYDYYKIYQKSLKAGLSPKMALYRAIDFGVRDEKTLHGYWASGVFSYADLEANYQGLRFYLGLCTSSEDAFRIEDYVNGYWDETFYHSHRLSRNWLKVSKVLSSTVCYLKSSPRVTSRMSYYTRTSVPSPSMKYLDSLSDVPGTTDQRDCDE